MKGNVRTLLGWGAVLAAAVIVDQAVKAIVEQRLELHRAYDIFPFFALFRTHNTGIAFSMLENVGATMLVFLTAAVAGFVIYLAARTAREDFLARLGFTLILAGALGNLIDRVSLGYVIDYFLFHAGTWSFAIFNLADSFITIGAGFVILQELINWRRLPGSAR